MDETEKPKTRSSTQSKAAKSTTSDKVSRHLHVNKSYMRCLKSKPEANASHIMEIKVVPFYLLQRAPKPRKTATATVRDTAPKGRKRNLNAGSGRPRINRTRIRVYSSSSEDGRQGEGKQ